MNQLLPTSALSVGTSSALTATTACLFSTSRRTVALLINPIVYLPSPLKKLAAKIKPMYIDIDTFTQYLYQLFKIQLPLPKICSSCVDNGSGTCYSQPGRPPKTTQNFETLKLGNVCVLWWKPATQLT